MKPGSSASSRSAVIAQQAADWLARRDRGLSPAEQDDYLRWLREDGRHAVALAAHEATLRRMMRLGEWQPSQSDEPNPDLFAPRRRKSRAPLSTVLAAAAAVALAAGTWWWQAANPPMPAAVAKTYLRVNERQALPDGTLVELKDGSRITVDYSASARRVRLSGEAHFTVTKNAARPFVVEAAGVAVRAVGTAFNVRQDTASVEVVVTEGSVRIDAPGQAVGAAANNPASESASESLVTAGHRAIVALATAAVPQVTPASAGEISETLSWQAPRLQFFETPLADAVAEFNRHNRQQLVLARAELGAITIGGTFRVNNVDVFVRLLETTLGVQVVSRSAERIVLSRAR